jgi:hypothetical protein
MDVREVGDVDDLQPAARRLVGHDVDVVLPDRHVAPERRAVGDELEFDRSGRNGGLDERGPVPGAEQRDLTAVGRAVAEDVVVVEAAAPPAVVGVEA